jgi:hypothetical protein
MKIMKPLKVFAAALLSAAALSVQASLIDIVGGDDHPLPELDRLEACRSGCARQLAKIYGGPHFVSSLRSGFDRPGHFGASC